MHPRTRLQTKELSRLILVLLGTTTGVTLTAILSGRLSPQIIIGFGKFTAWQIRKTLAQLKINRMIRFNSEDKSTPIVLTKKGLRRAQRYELRFLALRKPKRWDYLWRLTIFDIPERNGARKHFQRELKELGWYRLQDSNYVYPHEQSRIVYRLAELAGVKRHVIVLTMPHLGPFENKVRNHFFGK